MSEEEEQGLDFAFFAKVAGIIFGVGILAFIAFAIFIGLTYAWGLLGAFVVLFLGLILFGLFYDRRHQTRDLT